MGNDAPGRDAAGKPVRARLKVVRGLLLGMEYPLYDGPNVIGRAAEQPVGIDLTEQDFVKKLDGNRESSQYVYGSPNENSDWNCTWLERLMWLRLTGRMDELISLLGCCSLKPPIRPPSATTPAEARTSLAGDPLRRPRSEAFEDRWTKRSKHFSSRSVP
jgi:hypothetical protein